MVQKWRSRGIEKAIVPRDPTFVKTGFSKASQTSNFRSLRYFSNAVLKKSAQLRKCDRCAFHRWCADGDWKWAMTAMV
jgi:hypothetical protein